MKLTRNGMTNDVCTDLEGRARAGSACTTGLVRLRYAIIFLLSSFYHSFLRKNCLLFSSTQGHPVPCVLYSDSTQNKVTICIFFLLSSIYSFSAKSL